MKTQVEHHENFSVVYINGQIAFIAHGGSLHQRKQFAQQIIDQATTTATGE